MYHRTASSIHISIVARITCLPDVFVFILVSAERNAPFPFARSPAPCLVMQMPRLNDALTLVQHDARSPRLRAQSDRARRNRVRPFGQHSLSHQHPRAALSSSGADAAAAKVG